LQANEVVIPRSSEESAFVRLENPKQIPHPMRVRMTALMMREEMSFKERGELVGSRPSFQL